MTTTTPFSNLKFIFTIVILSTGFLREVAAEHVLNTRLEGGGGSRDSFGNVFESTSINNTKNASSGTSLADANAVLFGPSAGASATARYGLLRALASSFDTFDSRSIPYLSSDFLGSSSADFYDELTIRSNGTAIPEIIEVRSTWQLEAGLTLTVPDNGSISEQGTLWHGNVNYNCTIGSGDAIAGSITRGRYDDSPVPAGDQLPQIIVKQEGASAVQGTYSLRASVSVLAASTYDASSSDSDRPLSTGVTEGGSVAVLKLLSVEIIDPNTGELLPASVVSSSGHHYPVAQPPITGGDDAITAFTVDRETADVFLSFASEEGASYCVQGSNSLTSWDDLEVLTGTQRVSMVNVVDTPALTSSSRFYRVVRNP